MSEIIFPSSAQWPQDSSAALAPETLSVESLGAGLFGFTTGTDTHSRFVLIGENLVVIEVDEWDGLWDGGWGP